MRPVSSGLTELELRAALRARLREGLTPGTHIIEELAIERGSSRIDIAVVNGKLEGYEIKSDFDTLDRLAQQMHSYHRVFDELCIVTTKQYVPQVERLLPPWWGILQATRNEQSDVEFEVVREPSFNPRQEALSLLSLLWRDEAAALLCLYGDRTAKSKLNRNKLNEHLAMLASVSTLRDWVSHALRHREQWPLSERSRSRPAVSGS